MKNNNQNLHPCLAHHQLLDDLCKPLATLGVNFFGYTALDQAGNAFCLGSKSDYAEAYLARNHVKSDVHYRPSFHTKRFHYHFWDYVDLDEETASLYQMAAEFDQSHTLTVMRFDKDMTHCFHFSGAKQDAALNQRYLEKMDSIHAFIDYFDKCLNSVPEVAAIYDHPTRVNHARQEKEYSIIVNDPRLIRLDEVAQHELRFKNANDYYLSTNERVCLAWLRQGKSTEMIAQILGVSRKTIDRRISSLKKKFQCETLFKLGENVSAAGLAEFL